MKITDNSKQLIDWDKQQLVTTISDGLIVLTSTSHDEIYFVGLSIEKDPDFKSFKKSEFKLFNGTISND